MVRKWKWSLLTYFWGSLLLQLEYNGPPNPILILKAHTLNPEPLNPKTLNPKL